MTHGRLVLSIEDLIWTGQTGGFEAWLDLMSAMDHSKIIAARSRDNVHYNVLSLDNPVFSGGEAKENFPSPDDYHEAIQGKEATQIRRLLCETGASLLFLKGDGHRNLGYSAITAMAYVRNSEDNIVAPQWSLWIAKSTFSDPVYQAAASAHKVGELSQRGVSLPDPADYA